MGFSAQITGFGSSEVSVAFSDFSDVATGSSYQISGSDSGSILSLNLISPVSIGAAPTAISLTAFVTTNPTSSFSIELRDTASSLIRFDGSFSSFTTGATSTVDLSYVSGTTNGTINRIILTTNGFGNTLNVTLDNLATVSAVPEPATYAALFGVASLGFVAWRKRRAA